MKRFLFILLLCSPGMLFGQGYSLQECLDMAIANNYELKNSRIDAEMADQVKKEAFTRYFPVVSATGMTFKANEYLIEKNIDLSGLAPIFIQLGINPATLGLPSSIQLMKEGTVGMVTAIQPVFTGLQIVNGNKLAKVGKEVSELKISLSENEVISKTEEYYWQIVSLKEKLNTIRVINAQLAGLNKTLTAAVNAGVSKRNDLLRLELQQQHVESSRIKVENGIAVYKLLLCNMTGTSCDSFEINTATFPEVKNPANYFIAPSEGLEKRTESLLLDQGVKAASIQHKMTVGKNMPTVAAGAGYMYHNLMKDDVDLGLAFATVSIPISSWWGGSYEMKKEKLNMVKAENQRENMRELMLVDIQSKWNDLQDAYLQIQIANKSIESANENLKYNTDCYNAGTISLTDLLDAQTLVQQSRDEYTNASTTYYQKLSAYLLATGRKSSQAK